jgi:general nucleoside transport system permease protein
MMLRHSVIVALGFVGAVLRITVPYALAALGGAWSERAGVVNIALEGLLLIGAFASTVTAALVGSGVVGVLGGVAAGAALAALYALLVVRLRGDQIVCGVALNLLADGLTRFGLKAIYDSSSNSPRVEAFAWNAPGLAATLTHPLVIATVALVVASHFVLGRTRFGLRVRAVGEHPAAAASLGVRPARVRFVAVVLAGALAGLGGAWLAADQKQFVAGMSNGRGYIALAALIFGNWRPAWAAAAALLFGLAEAAQNALQTTGVGVPAWAVQMLPYVITMITLAGFIGRATPPKALGK